MSLPATIIRDCVTLICHTVAMFKLICHTSNVQNNTLSSVKLDPRQQRRACADNNTGDWIDVPQKSYRKDRAEWIRSGTKKLDC